MASCGKKNLYSLLMQLMVKLIKIDYPNASTEILQTNLKVKKKKKKGKKGLSFKSTYQDKRQTPKDILLVNLRFLLSFT